MDSTVEIESGDALYEVDVDDFSLEGECGLGDWVTEVMAGVRTRITVGQFLDIYMLEHRLVDHAAARADVEGICFDEMLRRYEEEYDDSLYDREEDLE